MARSKSHKPKHAKCNATGRSEGFQYFRLGYKMAKSPAWRSLSGTAMKVYIELRCRYNGRNNGRITLSLDEGKALLHLGKSTVDRALTELQEKGFILKTKQGFWYGRKASEWAVTDMSLDGYPPTNDWRRWDPKKSDLGPRAGQNTHRYDPAEDRG